MVYLFESELKQNKSLLFALKYVYGIGLIKSLLVCKKLGFSNNFKVNSLSTEQSDQLVEFIKLLNWELSSDLKKLKILIRKKLVEIKSYRGLRHNQGLPIRGQRTHTNAKTARKKF
jgi:small subunit ribosomal protein S13